MFDDVVSWNIEVRCPACQKSFEATAMVFPEDSGVSFSADAYEGHVERCPDFLAKYKELMGW